MSTDFNFFFRDAIN